MDKYILVYGIPVIEPDLIKWAEWFEGIANRRIAFTEIGKVHISTVFLGLDHNFSESGTPILFETMIFNGDNDQFQERYHTLEEAMLGHERAVAIVKSESEIGKALDKFVEKFKKLFDELS